MLIQRRRRDEQPMIIDALHSFIMRMQQETGCSPTSLELPEVAYERLRHEIKYMTRFDMNECLVTRKGEIVAFLANSELTIRKTKI